MALKHNRLMDIYTRNSIKSYKKFSGLNIYKIKGIEFSEEGYVAM